MPPRKKPESKKIDLNDEQQEVVSARAGYFCCQAGPGAGKSSVLVARIASLISEGTDPDSIVSLSFTKTAAQNLRDRVEQQVGKLSIKRTVAGASTFHALALSFAISERDHFGFPLAEFPLSTDPTSNKLSLDSARRYELDPRTLRPFISLCKRRRISPTKAVKDAENSLKAQELKLALAYKDYEKRLTQNGVLDFDSLIYHAVEILEKKPDVRERWIYDFVQVDEAQDCSQIEWSLVKLISGKSVLAVGDISQGLYSFRGSDPKLFANMSDMFPGTQTLFLSTNYRSTPEVIDFFRPFGASEELSKRFHTPNGSGPIPAVIGFLSAQEECAFVVAQIQKEIHGGDLL